MKTKPIRPKIKEIQGRFFEAIELLIESGRIERGLKGFCEDNGLNRTKYSHLANSNCAGYKLIDIDALYHLSANYNVSTDWLILGKGGMFR